MYAILPFLAYPAHPKTPKSRKSVVNKRSSPLAAAWSMARFKRPTPASYSSFERIVSWEVNPRSRKPWEAASRAGSAAVICSTSSTSHIINLLGNGVVISNSRHSHPFQILQNPSGLPPTGTLARK